MPWWSWLIIWAALIVALVSVVGAFAVTLLGKFMGVLDDLSALAGRADVLVTIDSRVVLKPQQLAVLADIRVVRSRRAARVARSVERRYRRREQRMARGRAIVAVDATTVQWPESFTAPHPRRPHRQQSRSARLG